MKATLTQEALNHYEHITSWMQETGSFFFTQEIGEAIYAASKGYYADNPPPDDSISLLREHAKLSMSALVEHGLIAKQDLSGKAIYQLSAK